MVGLALLAATAERAEVAMVATRADVEAATPETRAEVDAATPLARVETEEARALETAAAVVPRTEVARAVACGWPSVN